MGGYNNILGRDPGPLPPGFGPKNPGEFKAPTHKPSVNLKITRCTTKPWGEESTIIDDKSFLNITMSTTDKLSDLMGVLGLKSQFPTKHILFEITKSTSGGWCKGMEYHTLDRYQGRMLRELGWDETRTGNQGERPLVYLWVCEELY